MNPLSLKTHLMASVAAAGLASAATWQIQSWRCEAHVASVTAMHRAELAGRDELLEDIRNEANHQLHEQQRKQQKQAERLAALDTQHYQELRHAQKEADRLRADLAAGRRRLYVDTSPNQGAARGDSVPSGPVASGLDDGAFRAELHPEVAGRIVGIAEEADEWARKLTALQGWVRKMATSTKK